jgi:hypothetical protein
MDGGESTGCSSRCKPRILHATREFYYKGFAVAHKMRRKFGLSNHKPFVFLLEATGPDVF